MSTDTQREKQLENMAGCCREYLTKDECIFIGTVAMKHTARFATLVSAYSGQTYSGQDGAALMLRVAKRIHEGGGAS